MKNDLNKLRIIKEEIKTALLYKDYDKAMEGIGKLEDFIDNNKGNCIFCDFFNNLPLQIYPGTVPNSKPLEIRVTKTPEGKKKSFFDIVSIPDNSENSRLFNKHAERIVYALFGSSWAAMFTTETNLEKKQLYIVIFLCILYLSIEMVYRFIMQHIARVLHKYVRLGKLEPKKAASAWNYISDKTSYILLIKLLLIGLMVVVFGIHYCNLYV